MARYIDADKLCEGLKSMASVQEPYKQNTILGVVSTIENIHTADVAPRSEWISVDERLPDENKAVLIWDGKVHAAKMYKGITKIEREKMEKGELPNPIEFGWVPSSGVVSIPRSKVIKSCDEFGNNHVPYYWKATSGPMEWFGQNVTHWMPIPEPPQG